MLLQDIRYALRQLRRSPGFTVVAVLTLALGIGANTAIYSIIHGALRLPYPESSRMLVVGNVYPQASYNAASWPDFLEWRSRSRTFAEMAGLFGNRMTWNGILSGSGSSGQPQALNVSQITEGYFRLYGMKPILGRGFLPADHVKGAAPVCALDENFWREQLHSDPTLIGQAFHLDGNTCTVVGVMPRFIPEGSQPAAVWIPMEPNPPFTEHGTNFLLAVGQLRPGVTPAQALAELNGIQAQINKQFPDNTHGIRLQPLSEQVFGNLRSIMNILLAAVGFILLIACVNLANMLLARAAHRAREFAIRRALGASAARMMRQTLTESLLLSLAGAAVGLAFAELIIHIPIAAWPKGYEPPSSVHLDAAVLGFAALLAIVTGVLFGIMPALRILGQDETSALQQGRTITDSRSHNRTRSILVVAEIALSMLLVAGSLNMAFYFMRIMRIDPGVNPQNLLAMGVSLSPAQYPKADQKWRFYNALLDKLAALPGVTHVGAAQNPPFTGASSNGDFTYEGQPTGTADHKPFADFHFVTPGYFATVQTPILQGRAFTLEDRVDAPKVAIINREMAEKLWPGQSAIGKKINCYTTDGNYIVDGVAGDVRFRGPSEPPGYEIYLSVEQTTPPGLAFLLRTTGDPLAVATVARRAVASIDPGQAVSNVTTIQTLADDAVAGQRTSTLVTAILGCLALLLASIGVYGVMAYTVSRREREFGVRMALGADRARILRLLFSGVFRLVAAGILIGAGLVFAMRAWIDSLIGGSGTNPVAMLLASVLLCLVAASATFLPARRAARVQPMEALRTE